MDISSVHCGITIIKPPIAAGTRIDKFVVDRKIRTEP